MKNERQLEIDEYIDNNVDNTIDSWLRNIEAKRKK